MSNIVDARGLSCPQPVIVTMDEMKKVNKGEITIMVDTDTSVENVSRAAKNKGWEVVDLKSEDDGYKIIIRKEN